MERVIKVVRMQLINKWVFIGLPLLILGCSFIFSLAIFWIVREAGAEGAVYGGGAQAPMWYFLALGIQALTLTFPFSQAMSVSRRSFYLGTVLLFSACALALSIFYYLMGLVEKATGGWWLDSRFFALEWIADNNAAVQVGFYFVLMVLLFMIGFLIATIYMRWKTTGMVVFFIGLGVVLLGVAALMTFSDFWDNFWSWALTWTAAGVTLWGGAVAVVMAGGSYLTLRKATVA
ncbi:hypothetical protein CQ010_18080 [Arthrobacter sp. MYb211]|uniref:hypothetical protein n=2 Tax=Micrococcales TaxID=85006 RepID=UPI000CFD86FB|nr:hypothetical protein [Arthrobacter sp. MYb224]PRA00055.1 hypothetical protein CQ019_16255 [Arthrobacter sp. MYb229]PRA08228.1 hypothetical protein CQ015_18060 [Arthrobacter sp. MYb221]PRB48271.1 hypothetical protein CQ013_15010 [Arthrobacter sp. MYb216]PRC02844.1 hypothetical protein CQ010_18080 [Arthrobacter sp. MYb211]PQZ97084.1 hypothetical protein CQ017_14270 [Arthrobacter sp. MYb224]